MNVSKYLKNLCIILLIAIPFLVAFAYIQRYAISLVYMDEWDFIPLIKQWNEGNLTFRELFDFQHNEHKISVPLFLFLVIIRLTHYDTVMLQYASLGVIACTSIFMMMIARAYLSPKSYIALVPIGWIILGLRQWENLVCGFSLPIVLVSFFIVVTVWLLDRQTQINWRLVLAIITAILCTYSYANGLLVWPLCLLQLLANWFLVKSNQKKVFYWPSVIWMVFAFAVVNLYMSTYQLPNTSKSVVGLNHNLTNFTEFFLATLANPVSVEQTTAVAVGLIFILLTVWIIIDLIRTKNIFECKVVSSLVLLLFGFISTCLITAGRINLGLYAALSSRYASILNLGLVGLYLLIVNQWLQDKRSESAMRLGMFIVLLLIMILAGGRNAILEGNATRNARLIAANVLHNYWLQSDQSLKLLYPSPILVKEEAPYLRVKKMNVFRNPTFSSANLLQSNKPIMAHLDQINGIQLQDVKRGDINASIPADSETLTFMGWAVDYARRSQISDVYLTIDDNFDLPTAYGISRPDVAQCWRSQFSHYSGFIGTCKKNLFKNGHHTISMKVVWAKERTVSKSSPIMTINLE